MPAFSAVGTQFTAGAASITGTITAISFSGFTAAEIDITSITSQTKEFVLGTLDGGTCEVSCLMDRSVAFNIPTSGNSTATTFTIRFGAAGGGPTVTFTGYIANTSVDAGIDEAVTVTYSIRLTGSVTIAPT